MADPLANRDFLLALAPGLVYDLTQMWSHFHKAEEAVTWAELAHHAERFCDYLRRVFAARGADAGPVPRWEELAREFKKLATDLTAGARPPFAAAVTSMPGFRSVPTATDR